MKEKTFQILNDRTLLSRKEKVFSRLQDFYDGKREENTLNLNGYVFFPEGVDPYREPERWVDAALDYMAEHAEKLSADERLLRPLCIEFGPYGVHFVDKILGANVFMVDGQWNCEYLKTPIGSLEMPDLDKDPTWQLAERVAKYFVAQKVALPIFGLPTIASPLNVAVNLYGSEVFCAFFDDEEGIRHDLKVITDVQKEIHRRYREMIPEKQLQPVVSWERTQPYGCGQICGCSTQMLSGEMYREFIMDLDDDLLSVYPHAGMIHLCGSHAQHIENFAQMKNLKALQLHNRAAQDLKLYLEGLRKDQVIYVNCCEEMPYEEALKISGGERVIFVGEYEPVKKGQGNK
ncbi:MAG: hypothetical protein K2L87_05040 [Clostridiales bacterium]|nr:hypothetical protein [Clostridiales bacterium]